jgi:hypothetical protein
VHLVGSYYANISLDYATKMFPLRTSYNIKWEENTNINSKHPIRTNDLIQSLNKDTTANA